MTRFFYRGAKLSLMCWFSFALGASAICGEPSTYNEALPSRLSETEHFDLGKLNPNENTLSSAEIEAFLLDKGLDASINHLAVKNAAGEEVVLTSDLGADLLSTLDEGTYTIEAFEDNAPAPVASVAIALSCWTDTFDDFDITTNRVWTGDTGSWTVNNNSTSGPGASSSETLRLDVASGSGVAYIATEEGNWQDNQEWTFYTGRRAFPARGSNRTVIWLYADQADLSSPTINGYCLRHGDNSGNDEFRLQRVVAGNFTTILTGLSTPNELVDWSVGMRVTRDEYGTFTLSSTAMPVNPGDGVSANAVLDPLITVVHGSVTETTFTPSGTGYTGVYVTHGSNADARTSVEIDQFQLCTDGAKTQVEFTSAGLTVDESAGTITAEVSIDFPSATFATTVQVVLTSGDDSRIGGYTTQTLTFPAGSTANQSISWTIVDDAICSGDSELNFELQNPSGGIDGQVGDEAEYLLAISDENGISADKIDEGFESNNLDDWNSPDISWWGTPTNNAINGARSLRPSNVADGAAGRNTITYDMGNDHFDESSTTWQFSISVTGAQMNANNRFMVYLMSDTEDLTSGTQSGYALGVNSGANNNSDELELYKIDNGTVSTILTTSYVWNDADEVNLQVDRDPSGNWKVYVNPDIGFDQLTNVGNVTDTQFLDMRFFGIDFYYSSNRRRRFWMDNILVSHYGCDVTLYSQTTGASSGAIWDVVPAGTASDANINRFSNLVIQSGNTVNVDQDLVAKAITVESGGTLDGSAALVCAHGNWTNDGTFTAGTSEVAFLGLDPITVGGTVTSAFYDVTQENGTTVNMDNASVYGVAQVNRGTMNVSGSMTLISDASRTGSIGPLEGDADFTGNVTLQTFVPSAGSNGLINLSCPLTGVSLPDWQDDFLVTGVPGSFPDQFNSVRSYDEAVAGDVDEGFVPFNTLGALDPQTGYLVFGFPAAIDVDVTGGIQKGAIDLPLTFTNSGNVGDGWNLVTNVYPSQVDFDAMAAISTNVDSYSVYDGNTRSYVSYNSTTGLGDAPRYISSGQSIWVKLGSGTGTLSFEENVKSNEGGSFYRDDVIAPQMGITLSNGGFQDRAILGLIEGTTTGLDIHSDIEKLAKPDVTETRISLLSEDEQELKLQTLELGTAAVDVPVFISAFPGDYEVAIESMAYIPEDVCMSIEDVVSGEIAILEQGDTFNFTTEEEINEVRYIIHFSGAAEATVVDNTCNGANDGSITLQGAGQGPWTYTWYGMEEDPILTVESAESSTLTDLPAGVYSVSIDAAGSLCGEIWKTVTISEPTEEAIWIDTATAMCNEGMAEVTFGMNSETGFEYSISQDGALIESGSSEGENTMELEPGVYEMVMSNGCISETIEVDTRDANASLADFEIESQNLILGENETVSLTCTNTSISADEYRWFISDGRVIEAETLEIDFTESGEYGITLEAFNGYCFSYKTMIVVVAKPLGIENLNELEVAVYVNGDMVTIENGNQNLSNATIDIIDLTGKTVLSQNLRLNAQERTTLSTNGMAHGVYLVRVSQANQSWATKIFK